jgi:putative intracellular protease/amidase
MKRIQVTDGKLNGKLLVEGKTWMGFANSEEQYADDFVGKRIQPFRIEEEAKKIAGTNFSVSGRFKSHAVRDGNLITGQQQYSGAAVAPSPAFGREFFRILSRPPESTPAQRFCAAG